MTNARELGGIVAIGLVAFVGAGCGDDAGSEGAGSGGGATAGPGPGGTSGAGQPTTSSGGQGGGPAGTGGAGPGAGGSSGSGGEAGAWTPLVTGEWSLGVGEEITSGIFGVVAERDMVITAIRPIAPTGTHHTVVALGNFSTGNYIYASGVDTNELRFPEGVGLRIPAGENVILQLHVYNPTPGPLSGVSGVEVIEADAGAIEHEAEIFLPGPVAIEIPPMQEATLSGRCTVSQEQTIFALFPHMHQLGSHFRTVVNTGGESLTLHDDPYEFEHQPFYTFDPITLSPGDSIDTTCTWVNTTNQEVGWGESSNSEMCFSILYRWPALGGEAFCN